MAEEEQKQEGNQEAEETQEKDVDPRDAQISELTDTLQRLQAEFENFKKHVERDKCRNAKFSSQVLVEKLLLTLDTFDLALKNTQDHEQFVKGVTMIHTQLMKTLEDEGLRAIASVGERFDPYKHDVVMKEASDTDEDVILEEFQKGYMLHDRVIRHAKVKVSEKQSDTEKNSADNEEDAS